jgi:peptidyl-prolyl cis-trans isomerase A (cyclophilin A)
MDVVMSIVQDDEVLSVKIVRVGKKARGFKPTTESFKAMVEKARARVLKTDAAKKAKEDEIVKANWPGALETEGGVKYVVLKPGRGPLPLAGATLKIIYTGQAPLAGRSSVRVRRRHDTRQSGT